MRPNRSTATLAAALRPGLVGLALLGLPLAPAGAADPRGAYTPSGYGPAPGYAPVSPDTISVDGYGARRIELSIGRSISLELPRDAKEVFVANPAVANAVVRSARKMFLIGIGTGGTSVIAMDAEGRQISAFEVTVGRDLNPLRQTLRTAIPNGRIEVKPAGDSILLTGTVQTAGEAVQAADIAKAFVGSTTSAPVVQATNGTQAPVQTASVGQVINTLTIAGRDQVMLKVTVVEMARSAIKQLGLNVGGNWNVLDTAASFVNPASSLIGVGTGILASSLGSDGGGLKFQGSTNVGANASVGGTLQALERAGLSRVLAEPTLVAISGESATFHAGGEIPIIVTTVCQTGSFCPPTVTYKPYGVALAFTPVVLSPGKISLRVSTEVNELDKETTYSNGNIGFRTRKTATTVELPSGGTMVTAGLISSQTTQSISGIPGLINLPVLGALFRSRDFQRRDSELMIMVTPYLAKPMESAQAKRPDDGFQDPSDPQALLLGRLNRIYGTAGPGPARAVARTPGRFGFITD